MTVHVRCAAKVNLHLEVIGERPDGYHELRTLFAAIGIWDDLTFDDAARGVSLVVDPPEAVDAGPHNLVVRAARALSERAACRRGAAIRLRKRIPVGGGLGGGSSDAAATLVGLRALWALDVSDDELARLAAGLGADVPFFLVGGAAWGLGRGDELRPLPDLPPLWVVVLPGHEPVSTAEVYRRLAAADVDGGPSAEVYRWVERGGAVPTHAFRNDLEPTVLAGWPEVGDRLAALRAARPRAAMVSGSGGSVYGLFDREDEARRAAALLAGRPAIVAPVLTRDRSHLEPSSEGESWK